MGKYYNNQERYEFVRRYKISGKTLTEFAKEEGLNRRTLGDWVQAYNNLKGKFINVNNVLEKEEVEESDIKMNLLSECEIRKKSNHFSRFDHSIVVIEYKEIKITTSLEQAEKLLERLI